jgi:hypothetical protein
MPTAQPGIERGPPRLEVSTLENSHSNTFFVVAIWNLYEYMAAPVYCKALYTLQGAKVHMKDHQGKHTISFTRIALTNDAP